MARGERLPRSGRSGDQSIAWWRGVDVFEQPPMAQWKFDRLTDLVELLLALADVVVAILSSRSRASPSQWISVSAVTKGSGPALTSTAQNSIVRIRRGTG